MEIAVSCVQILQFLFNVYTTLKSNGQEARRLINRVESFHGPLDELIVQQQQQQQSPSVPVIATKQRGLENLQQLLKDVKVFIAKYSETTYYQSALNLAMRNSNAAELASFNTRITACSIDLQFGVIVDNESLRREQDLADAKITFSALLEQSVNEAATKDALDRLSADIATYQQSIAEMLRLQNYLPLREDEKNELNNESMQMTVKTERRLDEILRTLQRVEGDQQLILNIIENKHHSEEREKYRSHLLRELTKSVSDITLDALVGSGAFGRVFQGTLQSRPVAVKVLEARGSREGQRLSREEQRAYENELILMDFVKDPGILQVYGFAHDVHRTLLVLELAPFGSLWEMLCDYTTYPTLPMPLRISWLRDISCALISLFEKGIRHGDIKAQNALIFDGMKIKLCDFGTARKNRSTAGAQGTDSPRSAVVGGTLAFMAPEIRNCENAHLAGSDIFSLAVTAIQIFSRAEPNIVGVEEQIEQSVVAAATSEGDDTTVVCDSLVRLLKQAASRSATDRPSARQMMQQLTDLLSAIRGDGSALVDDIENAAKRFWKAKKAIIHVPVPPVPPPAVHVGIRLSGRRRIGWSPSRQLG